MTMDIKPLIESAIQSLSNNCNIETIMLKAQTIAHILNDDKFKKWINCEQNGYTDNDQLPSYRIIGCNVYLDISRPYVGIVKNFSFPPGLMDKYDKRLFSMPFHNSLIEIDSFSKENGQITSEIIAAMYPKINKYINGDILNAKQGVSPSSLISIISTFKSKLLDFFLQLNDKLDINLDLDKIDNKKTIETIMNQTIYAGVVNTGSGEININNSNIINGNDNQISIEKDLKKNLQDLLEKIKSIEITNKDDKQDLEQCINDIQNEIDAQHANPGIIRRALKVLKSIPLVVANKSIEIGIDKLLDMFAST